MSEREHGQSALSRLVGCWQGTLSLRTCADQPFEQLAGTAATRWVLGGRFVEMTLRAGTSGDTWSAVFYIGYERSERRHVVVSLEPGDRRVTTRLGEWTLDDDRLVLSSHQSRAVCDMTVPGRLVLELADEPQPGRGFVRLKANYRAVISPVAAPPAPPRELRRFVIA